MSTKSYVQVALFAALIAVLTQVAVIPLPGGVPITLQTLGVFLAGGLLGARRGALAVLIYIILGTAGIPVFAGGRAGIVVLLGPTGGYLLGFVIGAYLLGWIVERASRPGYGLVLAGIVAGFGVIYTLGTLAFMLITRMPLLPALGFTVIPFLPWEILKMALAVGIVTKARRMLLAAGYLDLPSRKA